MKNHAISQTKQKKNTQTHCLSHTFALCELRNEWRKKCINQTNFFLFNPEIENAYIDFVNAFVSLSLRIYTLYGLMCNVQSQFFLPWCMLCAWWCNVINEENVRSLIISNALTPTENCNSMYDILQSARFYASCKFIFNELVSRERISWKIIHTKAEFQYFHQLKYNEEEKNTQINRTNKTSRRCVFMFNCSVMIEYPK